MTDPFEPPLAVVHDAEDKTAAFGYRQIAWLVERGEVARIAEDEQRLHWRALKHSAFELDEMVLAEPSLRECDWCTACPADWRINLRHPVESMLGKVKRAMFACDTCAGYIRANDKRGLTEYAINTIRGVVKDRYGHNVPYAQAKQAVGAQVRATVESMSHARMGPPESLA